EDGVEVAGEAAGEARVAGAARRLARQEEGTLPRPRPHPGQELVEEEAQAVDVGGGGDRLPRELLRARVVRGHRRAPQLGGQRRGDGGGGEELGDAEIQELRCPVLP